MIDFDAATFPDEMSAWWGTGEVHRKSPVFEERIHSDWRYRLEHGPPVVRNAKPWLFAMFVWFMAAIGFTAMHMMGLFSRSP